MRVIEDIIDEGHGYITPTYLFVHSTANPGATAKNHRDAGRNGNWKYVTQYVCDWTGDVYHLMRDDKKAYAVGNGNAYGVNLEICEGTNQAQFDGSWNTAVEFCAWYLNKRGWGIDRLMSHNEARLKWGGTDHTDPDPYFKRYGRTWQQFKDDVARKMKSPIEEDDLKEIKIPSGTYDVFRLYNPNSGDHMFTTDKDERSNMVRAGWKDEGVAWKGADTGRIVYRLYNPNNGDHMFTIKFSEADDLVKHGWKYEGANFASARDGKPVFRLYNPNNGDHMFTPSASERDDLVKLGWKNEGVAFYSV